MRTRFYQEGDRVSMYCINQRLIGAYGTVVSNVRHTITRPGEAVRVKADADGCIYEVLQGQCVPLVKKDKK